LLTEVGEPEIRLCGVNDSLISASLSNRPLHFLHRESQQ